MRKLSFLFAALVAGVFGLSAQAEFTAWVYDYGANAPRAAQESWTEANLVDTSAGAANATFSGSYNNEVKCFDGNASTRWIQQSTTPWVIYKFDAATKISAYGIRQSSNNGYDNRVPVSWELYGSNAETPPTAVDDSSWVLLDTRVSAFHNYKGNNYDFGSRVMCLGQPANYRSYLLKVKSNNGDGYTVIGELEFYYIPVVVPVFGDCTFDYVQDGEYALSGVFTENAPTSLSLVLTPEGGGNVKSIVLDTPEVGVRFARTVSATGDGLSTTAWYSAKLVAENENGSSEKQLGRCWFGPSPRPALYAKKIEFTVSDSIGETLGESTMTDFPVLVRLSSAAVDGFDPADFFLDGRDLLFTDEDGSRLSFELDSFDPVGETLVWVKVPSLSAATKFICYYGGPENVLNEPTDVWTGYLGVWHFNGQENGVTPNATANTGLDGSSGQFTSLGGANTPFGSTAVQAVQTIDVKDYEPTYKVGKQFSASGWFKVPAQNSSTYSTFITKKAGLSWNADTGWYLEMSQSKTKMTLVPSSGSTAACTSVPDVTANWNYFTITHDNGSTKVYLNGGTSPVISQTLAINASSTMFKMLASGQQGDEYRLSKSIWSALRASLEYKSMKNADFLSNSGSSAMDVTAPVFETPVVTVSNDGTVSVSITVTDGEGDVYLMVNGEKIEPKLGTIGTDITIGTPIVAHPTIVENACASIAVYGINAKGTEVVKPANGGVMNAAVVATVVKNAQEQGLGKGQLAISRAEGAANDVNLIVNLSWAGTGDHPAVAGKNYVANLPSSVTIPAGEDSATVEVTPLIDHDSTTDTELTLTIAGGAYISGASAAMTILHLVAPAEYNTWVAAADGFASDGANWSKGVPQSDHKILFDPQFSTANCTWDGDESASGISSTIASLTIKAGYSGVVTLMTTFPEVSGSSFHVLTVTGDVEMEGGTISHAAHDSTHKCDYYRLRMDVGGDLRIASGASLSAYCKGSFGKRADGGDASYGGSYNGNRAWGSLERPYGVGASSSSGDGKNPVGYPAWAGGAIWVEVAGKTILDGKITAEGIHVKTQWDGFSGSGGAVYLKTKALEGAGTISGSADAGKASSNDKSGAGGRVAVELTESELTAFPAANITAYSSIASYENLGGAGTVYVRSPEKPNGILYLRDRSNKYGLYNYRPKVSQVTDIPKGQTWKLDGIVFGANSILRVPADATLELVNGLGSITSTTGSSLRDSGLYVDGGSLVLPEGDQTIAGTWTFQARGATIDRNVTVANGGAIGSLGFFVNSMSSLQRCDLTVTGDLTVDFGASISASYGGYIAASASMPGGTAISCHGGQNAQSAGNCAYDSFFNPNEAGAYGNDVGRYNVGGGVVKLVVGGTLTLNGVATAKPGCDSSRPGAAGTINITAARLEGTGSINADGNSREYYDSSMAGKYNTYGASGGGRVAVRLTGSGAEFTTEWISKITARGVASNVGDKQANSSSAGSVYLQSAAQSEKCGTIIIRNDNKTANDAWTALPGKDGVDQLDDFKKASLSLLDCGKVRLYETLQMANLTLVENCKLDLNGKTLTVNTAKLGDTKLKPGTYAASDCPEFLTGEGSLVVKGTGMVILVK